MLSLLFLKVNTEFSIQLLGHEIAIEVMGVGPVVLLGTANEAMGVPSVKSYFLKGLSLFDISSP